MRNRPDSTSESDKQHPASGAAQELQNTTETEMAGESSCKGLMSFPRHWKEEERRNAIIQTDQHLSVFSLPANYSEKNSTFSKKALAPPDVPLVFI